MYRNEIDELENLSEYKYENIFKVFQTETNKYYYYNITRTVRVATEDLDKTFYYKHKVNRSISYTALSYSIYGTIDLWWLICIINSIDDPVSFITPGTEIKLIKPKQVRNIIDTIKKQLL